MGVGRRFELYLVRDGDLGHPSSSGIGNWGFFGGLILYVSDFLLWVERFLVLRLRRATRYKRHGGAFFSGAKYTW